MSDTTIIITVLGSLGAVLLATAAHLSKALVRARAHRLPIRIASRMEEEWLGELNAITSQPGKLAFAIALTLTRRRAFAAPGEESMTEIHDRPGGVLTAFNGRKTLLILSTLIFAIAAYAASFLVPVRYASESLILIKPRDVPSSLVVDLIAGSAEERMKSVVQTVTSRTSLAAISREFSQQIAQKGQPLDRTIEGLRKDIAVIFSPSPEGAKPTYFRMRYVGSNPEIAQKVAQKLTALFIEADGRNREGMVAGTRDFLKRRLDALAERLTDKGDELARERAAHGPESGRVLAIDYDQLVSTYKATFAKLEDAQMASDLENERRGEGFVVVDPARLGEPVVPNRLAITGLGALVGFALGGVAVVGWGRRQRRALA